MDNCMKMLGGGPWKVGAGQITDDSELAMCILHALAESGQSYDQEIVANYLREWIRSKPFDIGNNTRVTLGVLAEFKKATAKWAKNSAKNNS